MRIPIRPHRACNAIVATLILTGCAGGTTQLAPATSVVQTSADVPASRLLQAGYDRNPALAHNVVATPSFMNRSAIGKPLLFVSDIKNKVVDIYLQSGSKKMVGQITGLYDPLALATDNLYVSNTNGLGVQVYAPPYTGTPTYSLETNTYHAYDVGISTKGLIGVRNYCAEPMCYPNSSFTEFFAPNSTIPCATVQGDASVKYGEFGSFDRRGNYFTVDFDANQHSILGEIRGGCKAKKMNVLSAAGNNGTLGAPHVNASDQIAVPDTEPPNSNDPPVIYTYDQPAKHNLGIPVSTTLLHGSNRVDALNDFAFQGSGKNLFFPDSTNGNVNEYAYPAGGAPIRTISLGINSYITGVAVTPPLLR